MVRQFAAPPVWQIAVKTHIRVTDVMSEPQFAAGLD
jgi:hypothetical protein